jgi:predicted ATPase
VLSALTIQGFKAVFDASLSALGPFTLLIGRNGSGKSSAVEAIQWLRDATFLGVAAATSGYGGFDDLCNRRSTSVRFDLLYQRDEHARPVHYVLEVGARKPGAPAGVRHEHCVVGRTSGAHTAIRSRTLPTGQVSRSVRGLGRPLIMRDGNELALRFTRTRGTGSAPDLVDFLERAVFLRLSPTAIAAPSRMEPRAWRPLLSDDGHDLASLLMRMSVKQLGRVAQRLHDIFPDVEGLTVEPVGQEHRFTVRERMRARGGTRRFDIPSSLLSEGMRRLVAIFALLEAKPRPSLLVIEEIENGLDPWTLQHVLDALQDASGEIQILLTTHSPFLLDHVDPSQVIHVRRQKGDTTYQRVSEIAQVARYEGVLAPGAMYLSDIFESSGAPGGAGAPALPVREGLRATARSARRLRLHQAADRHHESRARCAPGRGQDPAGRRHRARVPEAGVQ